MSVDKPIENTENRYKFRKEIEALSNVSIKGKIFEETPETVVVQMNHSLLEMHRDDIASISKIKSDQEPDLVSVSIRRDAFITEKKSISASQAATSGVSGTIAAIGAAASIGNAGLIYIPPPYNCILYPILVQTDTGLMTVYSPVKPGNWPHLNTGNTITGNETTVVTGTLL